MKLIIALLILFTIGLNAQSKGTIITSRLSVYADSLQYQTDAVAGKDSVWILSIPNSKTVRLFIKGNANSPVDSLAAQLGSIRYTETGVPVDTIWGSYVAFKDSAWNTVNTLINNTVGKDFSLYVMPAIQLMKISIRNHRGTLPTRKNDIVVDTSKD